MIVLNEHEWAKQMIRLRTLGKKPFETFTRIARYYYDNGVRKRDIIHLLETFLIQCDPAAPIPKWSKTIEYAVDRALKRPAVLIDYISITSPEMEAIEALAGKRIQRLAFTLLCLSKYWDVINSKPEHWVNTDDHEIMRLANVNTSIKQQSAMYHTLNSIGMVSFSKMVDNTNVKVEFATEGDEVMRVSDFRNLGNQYLKYHGEPYYECQNCGIVTKIPAGRGPKPRYCRDCAVEVATQNRVNSVMRLRAQNRADNSTGGI